jgi:hypothetical protein
MIKNANSYSGMAQRIDGIGMSKSDRQLAKEHLQDAELMTDLICRACDGVQSAEALLGRLFAPRAS